MKYQELIILLPCHSLEDFPVHHEGEDADGLLANWTALWHPALIASAAAMPTWFRVDDPPEELEGRLLAIPSVSQSELPTGFTQRAKQSGAIVVRRKFDRHEIIDQALQALDAVPDIPSELVADFLALGYCFLQVELLTRQMRYSSNLDELHFQNQVVAAAQAAAGGDQQQAQDVLTNCFDILAEERDHYYSVDAFLLDLTMVADTTLGDSLRGELNKEAPVNLLLSGELLEAMASKEPATVAAIKAAANAGRVGLLNGTMHEGRWPLQSCESLLAEIQASQDVSRSVLGVAAQVFGRQRFGLTPLLPQLLHKTGFTGALHATFEDGRFPEGSQFKIRWEGCDSTAIDAIARTPLVATQGSTFLTLATKLGESMDMDHVATLLLAHWAGQTCPWYEDLRRIARYGNALGRFVTIEEYFRDTDLPGHLDSFPADQYKSPYLKQAVIRRHADPISSCVQYWRQRTAAEMCSNLRLMTDLSKGRAAASASRLAEIDARDPADFAGPQEDALRAGRQDLDEATAAFGQSLPRSDSTANSMLLVNPQSFTRRMLVETNWANAPHVEGPVYAAHASDAGAQFVVDVPSMGFTWVKEGTQRPRVKRKELLAEECLLRNEFFEALINPQTGSLQSLNGYETRGNRLSQQIAYREPTKRSSTSWQDPDSSALYSKMKAEQVEVVQSTPIVGEIATRGVLLHPATEAVVGRFRQNYRVSRGSRVLAVSIEIEPQAELKSDPWNSYFACRFAWPNEAATMHRAVNCVRQAADSKRFEAPLYVTIDDVNHTTTVLTGGLPFHCRQGLRSLDSILLVRGESARKFKIGIGVDLPYPIQQGVEWISTPTNLAENNGPPRPSASSWLVHTDAKNTIATHWSPLVEPESDRIIGIRTRLLETQSRAAECVLRCFREFREAKQVQFNGEPLGECRVVDGGAKIQLAANEWVEVEALF